jgi:predicted small metal-binding protein
MNFKYWNDREIIYNDKIISNRCTSMPSFKCKDIGMDCKFETTAPTEAELMKKIAEHAKSAHKMETIPPDVMAKVKAAIKK